MSAASDTVRRRERVLFITAVGLFAVLIRPAVSANDGSRLATVESIVERGTLAIDRSSIFTIDKYRYDGHFYSDKPALMAIYAAGPYAILRTGGVTFSHHMAIAYALITLLTIGVPNALGLIFLRRTLLRLRVDPEWADVVVLLALTGTLFLPYSTVFSNHALAATLLIVGFHHSLRMDEGPGRAALTALFTALAGAIDISTFLFLPAFALSLLGRPLRSWVAFATTASAVVAAYFLLNRLTSGSFLPPAMNKSLWDYPGSDFGESSLTGLAGHSDAWHLARYGFHMLFGHRGLFSYTPIAIFSVIGVVWALRQKDVPGRRQLTVAMLASAAYVGTYLLRSVNYGGACYGVRWYADVMLLLCVPIGFVGERVRSSAVFRRIFLVAAVASILISFVGVVKPFTLVDDAHPNPFINCILDPFRANEQLARAVRYCLILILGVAASIHFCRRVTRFTGTRGASMSRKGRSLNPTLQREMG